MSKRSDKDLPPCATSKAKGTMGAALFQCAHCGGDVVESGGEHRTYSVRRGLTLPVPSDFMIPTCRTCHEQYFTVELAERLEAVLETQEPPR